MHDREPSKGAALDGYFENLNSVYLVNPTLSEIYATVSTSGFFSVEEIGVLEAPARQSGDWIVRPLSYVCIENPSDDELDEVHCSWSLIIDSAGKREHRSFSAGKRRAGTIYCPKIPIIGKPGMLISQQ